MQAFEVEPEQKLLPVTYRTISQQPTELKQESVFTENFLNGGDTLLYRRAVGVFVRLQITGG